MVDLPDLIFSNDFHVEFLLRSLGCVFQLLLELFCLVVLAGTGEEFPGLARSRDRLGFVLKVQIETLLAEIDFGSLDVFSWLEGGELLRPLLLDWVGVFSRDVVALNAPLGVVPLGHSPHFLDGKVLVGHD